MREKKNTHTFGRKKWHISKMDTITIQNEYVILKIKIKLKEGMKFSNKESSKIRNYHNDIMWLKAKDRDIYTHHLDGDTTCNLPSIWACTFPSKGISCKSP
jgi:hypothetical protein